MDGYSYLTFDQRRKIEALYSDGERGGYCREDRKKRRRYLRRA